MRIELLLIALLCSPAALAQRVTDEVDRFTGERKIAYTARGIKQPGQPIITFKTFKVGSDTKLMANFGIFPQPKGRYGVQDFVYLRCHDVNWLVDGNPVAMGVVTYDFTRIGRSLLELVSQEIPLEAMRKIGAASKVEFRICSSEFALTGEDIRAAKTIADKLSAPAGE